MGDYRGGPRQQSGYGQELVKAIREGRTGQQQRRDFGRKLTMGVIQGGLTAASGIASGVHSNNENARRELHQSSEQYAAPEYRGRSGEAPEWLGQAGEGNIDVIQRAEAADSRMGMNASRELAPIDGHYTPAARENENAQAGALVRDMGTAEMGMRQATGINPTGGGMMGEGESGMYRTLPGRQRR